MSWGGNGQPPNGDDGPPSGLPLNPHHRHPPQVHPHEHHRPPAQPHPRGYPPAPWPPHPQAPPRRGTGPQRGDRVHKPGWSFVKGLIGVIAAAVVGGFTWWIQQDVPNPIGAFIGFFGGMLAFIAVTGYHPAADADETEMWVKMAPASQVVTAIGALALIALGLACAFWENW